MNNSNFVIYDYVTFTSKIHDSKSAIDMLGLQDVKFENLKGFYGYRDRLYYDGISVHYNGRDDMGICVEMSGHGCRSWEKYGNSDYDGLFLEILSNYSEDSENRQMNLTRLDVAYDDFLGVLDLPLLCMETQKQNFVSRFKDWQVIFGNRGIGVNHGSNKSNVYIRIYDKRLEQNFQDKISHWVRCELQMRKECAVGFIMLLGSVQEKYFQVLNNYLRYVVPSDNISNSSMLETAVYWLKFLESAEKSTIFHKPAFSYTFEKLYGFVNNQLSGAISNYIDIVGAEQFIVDIYNSRKGKKLNPKYQELKEKSESGNDGILKYLQERGLA